MGQLVHYAVKSPPVPKEVWLGMGRKGLWRSGDDAVTSTRVSTVESITNYTFGAPAPGSKTLAH
jgi:hypothetical protein